MAKKELIEKWESKEGVPSYEISAFPVNPSLNEMYIAGYGVARKEILDDLKQLDEPKKVVIPQVVADWIKYAKRQGYGFMQSYDPIYMSYPINDGLDKWIDDNEGTFAHAWLDGYEVEKEQLYKVVIDHKHLVQIFSGRTDARLVEYEELTNWHDSAYKLTESVIKSIDERYWPFAVKVGNK
ncbi:DUF1642 domain-containing protein [Enterococcus faecalis]|uniref:DUF1642 domain-containing protein n=1 Tax=Enterococcus faecalis TaxID=1351 RepID=UPI001923634F|nr:DUF1642 domain-containing protein [Enterococcus faecalis]EGO6689277.1 DUF1642 domain-containing protein [Enterococcus faecalis]EGO8519052.1 DUF1642 domain-containing protein [Enterococcus faecalis]EID1478416.1 DUF1642 domain-containing protein [Enterococcus faecalis]EJJ0974341.1 DUF1642 domain-containing protein [Enterococcus faecalis]